MLKIKLNRKKILKQKSNKRERKYEMSLQKVLLVKKKYDDYITIIK